jgi:hypothetical protein
MAPSATSVAMAAAALVALGASDAPSRASEPAAAPELEPAFAASVPPAADPPAAPAAPAFEEIPWSTGPDIGTGIAMKDTGDPGATNAFIGYAGYNVSLADAEAWVTALHGAWLRDRGVRYVWAVRGPDDSHYEHKELGNTKIGARLRAVAPAAGFVLVAAHSSGSCVAHELFEQLAGGRDPEGATAGKIVYFNLDGIEKGLTRESVARLRRAYFVGAVDPSTDTASPNDGDMRRLGAAYADQGAYVAHDARAAECAGDASWCLHVTLVTKRPHSRRAATAHLDYTDFEGGGVETAFFDEKAEEAGLVR